MTPLGFEKTAEEVAALDKQIRKIFSMYEVSGLKINNSFVELTYRNIKDPRAGNSIDYKILKALHSLLKPKRMEINAWTEVDGCEHCRVAKDYGYVVAYFFDG